MIRRQVLPIALPFVVIGGYIAADYAGGILSDVYEDFGGPFLITYWIGLGFTNMWDIVKQSLHGASPLILAVVGVGGSLFMLGMLGGPEVIVDEPWLFGAAIAPGLELTALCGGNETRMGSLRPGFQLIQELKIARIRY